MKSRIEKQQQLKVQGQEEVKDWVRLQEAKQKKQKALKKGEELPTFENTKRSKEEEEQQLQFAHIKEIIQSEATPKYKQTRQQQQEKQDQTKGDSSTFKVPWDKFDKYGDFARGLVRENEGNQNNKNQTKKSIASESRPAFPT